MFRTAPATAAALLALTACTGAGSDDEEDTSPISGYAPETTEPMEGEDAPVLDDTEVTGIQVQVPQEASGSVSEEPEPSS